MSMEWTEGTTASVLACDVGNPDGAMMVYLDEMDRLFHVFFRGRIIPPKHTNMAGAKLAAESAWRDLTADPQSP